MKSSLSFFSIMVIAFSDLRNAYPKVMKVVCFLSKALWFYLLHFIYDSSWIHFCVWCQVGFHVISLIKILWFQHCWLKMLSFPITLLWWWCFVFFPKKSIIIRVALFLDSLFCLLDLWNPIPRPQCQDYCTLIVFLEFE